MMRTRTPLKRTEVKKMFFYLSYFLFWISFFINDIEQNTLALDKISSLIRYISFIVAAAGIVIEKSKIASIKTYFIIMIFGIFTYVTTRTTFFIGIALLTYYTYEIKDKEIIEYSFYLLMICAGVVIVLQFFGILHNSSTPRWINETVQNRNTIGFCHSNVLPLISLYSMGYFLLTKNNRLKFSQLIIMMAISIVIYLICGSRNVLLSCSFMILASWYEKSIRSKIVLNRITNILARYIVPIWCLFSLSIPLLINRIDLLHQIDLLFSYRFTYALQMVEALGICLFRIMDSQTYAQNASIIDNGYILIALRYGIVYLIFLTYITYKLAIKYRKKFFVNLVIIVIATANLIDNDLFDYLCIPFLLIAIKAAFNKQVNKSVESEGLYGSSSCFNNNECIQ